MAQLLVFREHLQKFYQKYTTFLNLLFRFVIGFIAFSSVNRMVGYNTAFNQVSVELLLAAGSMLMPGSVLLFFTASFVVVHIFYVSRVLALIIAVIFLIFYFGYAKFVPKHAYIIFAVPIAIPLHLVHGIPIILGLFMTPAAIVPISCGVGIYYLLQSVTSVVNVSTDTSINLYQAVLQQFLSCREMYVMIIVFSIVTVVVYILRNREWDFAFEIAIFAGAVANTILFLVINYLFNINIKTVPFLLGMLCSAAVAWFVQFMRLALNYTGVENLQFEDEEYYYYVRAVPKMNVAAPSKRVKRINVRHFSEHMPDLKDEKGRTKISDENER
ncbi:MAG: hypothetical protein HFH70_01010 [Lachnospiraceae bacterium]|nr:hypothetical protein [Lachnospiraceae bacterium]